MKKIVGLGLVLAIAFGLSACGGSETSGSGSASSSAKTEENSSPAETPEDETKPKVTFENDTITTPDYVFKLTGSKIVTDVGDDKALFISYDFTNNTDEPQTPLFPFSQYTKLEQETDTTIEQLTGTLFSSADENEDVKAVDMAHSDIKPGVTVKCAELVKLVNDKPVKMTISNDSFEDIAEKEYKVQ